MRAFKFITGLILLPACLCATLSSVHLVQLLQLPPVHSLPVSFWGLIIGFFLWILLYLTLPRPFRTYVLGHELTHALWAWLMGAKVGGVRVSSKGGSVKVSKNNFLIGLAPYFFPFYTVCVIILHFIISLFYDTTVYEPFWMGCIGLTWGFHLTFTISMLRLHQPDIREHGRLFSYTVIYFLNMAGIGLWIVFAGSPTLEDYLIITETDARTVIQFAADGIDHLKQLAARP